MQISIPWFRWKLLGDIEGVQGLQKHPDERHQVASRQGQERGRVPMTHGREPSAQCQRRIRRSLRPLDRRNQTW
jgi:hypothetical protein